LALALSLFVRLLTFLVVIAWDVVIQ
jgi:hypothetical protein